MKLIKCHIENFGKLSDFTYDFTDGCNTRERDTVPGKRGFMAENCNSKVKESNILSAEPSEVKAQKMNFS